MTTTLSRLSCACALALGLACGGAADTGDEMPAAAAGRSATPTAESSKPAAAASDYTVTLCPGQPARMLSDEHIPCDGTIRCGGAARCSGNAAASMRTPDCSAGKCVPDAVATGGKVRFKPCEGTSGIGVCMPLCFALVNNPLSITLPKGEAGCGSEEICAPCANPLDGTVSGACADTCAAN